MPRLRAKLLSFTILASCGLSSVAWAQSDQQAPESQDKNTIQEVVVSARKRSESLEKTPVAITVITAEQLQKTNTENLTDVTGLSPSVQVHTLGEFGHSSAIDIRGIGYDKPNIEGDPSVAVYVDGLYETTNTTDLEDLFDIQSVQILRGPQGTLFGRNAFGGAIDVATKSPSGKFDAEGEATLGNYGRRDVKVAVDMPITDTLSGRLAFLSGNSDGFYRNTLYGQNSALGGDASVTVRPSLLWKPTEKLSVLFKYNYVDDQSDPTPNKYESDKYGNLFNDVLVPLVAPIYDPNYAQHPGLYAPNYNVGSPFDIQFKKLYGGNYLKINTAMTKVDYDTGYGQLTSISGFQHTQGEIQADAAGTPLQILLSNLPYHTTVWSQELRFLTHITDDFQLLSGLYFLHDDLTTGLNARSQILGDSDTISNQDRNSAAGFLDGEYTIIDGLRLDVGVRYNYEHKSFMFSPPLPPNQNPVYTKFGQSFYNFSPKASIDYQLDKDTLIYATYSKGFKSGGFNALAATQDAVGPYGDEKMDSYEGGVKSFFWNRRARLNADVFYEQIYGLQRSITTIVNGHSNNAIVNAANATSRGVELEGSVIPVENLTINGSLSFLDASYDTFCGNYTVTNATQPSCGPNGAVDNTNLKLTFAPKWEYTLAADYEIDTDNIGGFLLHADGNFSTSLYTADDNAPIARRSDMAIFNASVKWTDPSERYYIRAYARNLTNRVSTEDGVEAAPVFAIWNPTPPRTYGVTLGFKFNPEEEPTPAPVSSAPAPMPAPAPPAPPAPAPEPQRVFQVFFDFDKSAITEAAAQVISQAADHIKAGKDTQIVVTGHTDTVGSVAYNQHLSERRAAAVKAALVKDGVASQEITTKGVGKSDLLVPTPDGVREPQNRRAEIVSQ